MSNVTPLHSEHHNPFVTHAADEIRGIMAAKRIPGYKLPALTQTATSRGYWQRRLNGEVAFDLDDLSYLAEAFEMTLPELLARLTSNFPGEPSPVNTKKAPTRKGEGQKSRLPESNWRPIHYKWDETTLATITPLFRNVS